LAEVISSGLSHFACRPASRVNLITSKACRSFRFLLLISGDDRSIPSSGIFPLNPLQLFSNLFSAAYQKKSITPVDAISLQRYVLKLHSFLKFGEGHAIRIPAVSDFHNKIKSFQLSGHMLNLRFCFAPFITCQWAML
jgi:hypothetical protein